MKKLASALISICMMLMLPLYAYADIPALPRETTPRVASLTIVMIVAVVVIAAVILFCCLRKRK